MRNHFCGAIVCTLLLTTAVNTQTNIFQIGANKVTLPNIATASVNSVSTLIDSKNTTLASGQTQKNNCEKYSMQIVPAPPLENFKTPVITSDPKIDYKAIIINPCPASTPEEQTVKPENSENEPNKP